MNDLILVCSYLFLKLKEKWVEISCWQAENSQQAHDVVNFKVKVGPYGYITHFWLRNSTRKSSD